MNNLRTLTNMKKAIFTTIAVASLAILPATAQAVPIVGTLDMTGAVRVTPDSIDWLPQGLGRRARTRRGDEHRLFCSAGEVCIAIEQDLLERSCGRPAR